MTEIKMPDSARPRACPSCQCGLYEVFIDPDTNAVVAIECNMCGDRRLVELPRTMTIDQAGLISDLMAGVERGLKLRYYPRGSESADNPMVAVLRAFTYAEGALYPHNADIRDAHVWTSGFTESFIPVEQLIKALDNIDGKHGDDEPIATIDKE